MVSIPHRYGKNAEKSWCILTYLCKFPFLIGTVRTWNWCQAWIFRHGWFPFLIGTVRTWTNGNCWFCWYSFPFLIGTVRTVLIQIILCKIISVSIPHRYGKNWLSPIMEFRSDLVSIPHRYGKNKLPRPLQGLSVLVSIPHRYGKNPLRALGSFTAVPSFHSS